MPIQLDHSALCNSILDTSRNIQSVAVINKQGKATEKIARSRFADQFPDDMNEMFFMQCVLQISMGRNFDEQYGPINYYISERDNLTMLTFPIGDYVLLVTINKNASPISLARKITNIINECKRQSFGEGSPRISINN